MAFFNSFYDKGLIERLDGIISSDFGHITYTEAIEILEKAKDQFQYPVYWGCDLQTEHERYLTEQVMKRPVFVTDYPKAVSYTHLDVYKRQLQLIVLSGMSPMEALAAGVLPFAVFDIVKAAISAVLASALYRALGRARLLAAVI